MDDKDDNTINLDEFDLDDTITIDTSSWYDPSMGNITISATGNNYGSATISSGSTGASWTNSSPYGTGAGLHVENDAHFDGDIMWQGRSLGTLLEKIESRLAILTPDLEKLEHFAALKKAYDNYKMLEKLCELPTEETDD